MSDKLDAEDQRILGMSKAELEADLQKRGETWDQAIVRISRTIQRARIEAAAAPTLTALRSILMECDEAPTEHNAWVVAIQKLARDALAKASA